MDRLVVLSDVHLGSDLNDVGRPVPRSRDVDADLVRLLEHYRTSTTPGDHLRVVFAGDLIDFVGMMVHATGAALATERSHEERVHGLGNAADHAQIKLRLVVERHGDVFDALADLVAAGQSMDIVHGNHDLEFHWDGVKDQLRSTLLARAIVRSDRGYSLDARAFGERIRFCPWFLYLPGIAYIEHGHQYDAFCASDCVMAPLSPADPRRIMRSVADVLLRFVVRTTRGMREYGHETQGVTHYLAFGARLGPAGLLKLGASFANAVLELFRLRREHLSPAARAHREEHERRMVLLAEATTVGVERIRAIAALQMAPATHTIRGILASVLLDRLALAVAAWAALLLVAFLSLGYGAHAWLAAPLIVVAWAAMHWYFARQRHVDPERQLLERAGQLARLFPAVFVVMGHTHTPARIALNEGASTYINLGSWAEEETDARDPARRVYCAARTHLVMCAGAPGPVAQLLAWGADGPRPWVSDPAGGTGNRSRPTGPWTTPSGAAPSSAS
jgi:UDP-2,3-diacylglucosamine pyrophosphatase LpxH